MNTIYKIEKHCATCNRIGTEIIYPRHYRKTQNKCNFCGSQAVVSIVTEVLNKDLRGEE